MTLQTMWLLHLLKKAQMKENNVVSIHAQNFTAGVGHNSGEKCVIVNLSPFSTSLESCLNDLLDSNYITHDKTSDLSNLRIQVNHRGWHYWQTIIGKLLSFMFRSIAIPIVVAFFTALITIALQGAFQSK